MPFDETDGRRRDYYEAMAREQGVPFVDLAVFKPDSQALNCLTVDIARTYCVLPLKKQGGTLFVAFADIADLVAQDMVRLHSGCQVRPVLAIPEQIDAAIERFYVKETPEETPPVPSRANSNLRRDRYLALAQEWMVPFVDLTIYIPDRKALDCLTPDIARRHRVLPVKKQDTKLFAAFATINDLEAQEAVRRHCQYEVLPVVAVPEVIDANIERFYSEKENPDDRSS